MAATVGSLSHFSKLLRISKVVGQVDCQLEQVYTAYDGYLHQNRDFGLKRCLPQKLSPKSPWIRLKALDTSYQQTEYRSASAEASVVRMWQQLELGVKTARKRHAPLNVPSEPRPIRIEYSWFDEASCESARANLVPASSEGIGAGGGLLKHEKGRIKHIWTMHQAEFDRFLDRIRDRRSEFRQFLKARQNRLGAAALQQDHGSPLRPTADGAGDEVDLYRYAQRNPDQIRKDIQDFMAHLAEKEHVDPHDLTILPMPHPNLALNYAHFDLLHNERLTPPVPGRVLDQADMKSSRQTVSFGGVVATMQRSSHIDLPSTSFEPDTSGYHNLDQGKATFRLETAAIDPYELPRHGDFQGFRGQIDQPVRYSDPRDKPRALEPNRLKVQVREGAQSDMGRINSKAKIGSMDWVGSDPPKRQASIVLDFLSSVTKNLAGPSSSSLNQQDSSSAPRPDQKSTKNVGPTKNNPRTNRMAQEQSDQLLKVLQDLVAKTPSS